MTTCGLKITNWRPVASMLPQSAVGGWLPSPRKERPAVARIFAPTSRLKATMTGERSCGTMGRTEAIGSVHGVGIAEGQVRGEEGGAGCGQDDEEGKEGQPVPDEPSIHSGCADPGTRRADRRRG